jgi:predicted nucleic acid-binding protein
MSFAQLANERRPLLTSNLVVAESHALMMRRLGRDIAGRWLAESYSQFNVVLEGADDSLAARGILVRYADKAFSYADAVSFAIMERLGIRTAFSFDEDFRQFGLDVIP